LSDNNPYEKLGLPQTASFEEIQEAKQRLVERFQDDTKAVESIEAAYDAIIMERLKMRQEGRIKVPEGIRFAEREYEVRANPTPISTPTPPVWLRDLLDKPSPREILINGAVFVVLSLVTIFGDIQLLTFLISMGFFANIYLLNRKEQRFGRAFLLSLIGLTVGVGLGTVLANLLNIQSFGLSWTVEQFAALVTFCLFWLTSSFLR
jgi:hypothetical protein